MAPFDARTVLWYGLEFVNNNGVEPVKPTFEIHFLTKSRYSVEIGIQPPRRYANKAPPFYLSALSKTRTIGTDPFQLTDHYPEDAERVTGGVAVSFDERHLLFLIFEESTIWDTTSRKIGRVITPFVSKAHPDNLQIKVVPILKQHGEVPYVLQNNYNGRPGLLITGDRVNILDAGNDILIARG